MIRCRGLEFDSVGEFDCHLLRFNYVEGGGWATVLPISSLEFREGHNTGAYVDVLVGLDSTEFVIFDDAGQSTVVDIDTEHSAEIFTAVLAAMKQRLLRVLDFDKAALGGLLAKAVLDAGVELSVRACEWVRKGGEESGLFNTGCGHEFLAHDGFEDVGDWAAYCVYCGGALVVTDLEKCDAQA